jgi:hypothetical protein
MVKSGTQPRTGATRDLIFSFEKTREKEQDDFCVCALFCRTRKYDVCRIVLKFDTLVRMVYGVCGKAEDIS